MIDKNKLLSALEQKDYEALDKIIEDNPSKAKEVMRAMRCVRKGTELAGILENIMDSRESFLVVKIVRSLLTVVEGNLQWEQAAPAAVRGGEENGSLVLVFGDLSILTETRMVLRLKPGFKKAVITRNGEKLRTITGGAAEALELDHGDWLFELDGRCYKLSILP